MRFKLVLLVKTETFGNTLPVSYQYELSSCIYRKLTMDKVLYNDWLNLNGFNEESNIKHKLFSISNLYIPKIKVVEDRINLLARKVQLWISFLPERNTKEFLSKTFLNQGLLIGDRKSQVEFIIESIEELSSDSYPYSVDYLSLSPIVASTVRMNKSVGYIGPDDDNYVDILLNSLLEKYEFFYGHKFPYSTKCTFQLLSEPKRKGIFIKRFTTEETKVIGYMYKFRLNIHPSLHHLMYNTGIGDKIGLGFGCVEMLDT